MIYLLDKTKEWETIKTLQRRKFEHEESQKLLSYAIQKELGMQYEESMVQIEANGKPNIHKHSKVEYNYSHCNGLITCVLSDKPVGIDVEKIRPFHLKTLQRMCDDKEYKDIMSHKFPQRRFFEYWTLKESYVKAIGTGIYQDIYNIHFVIRNNDTIQSNKLGFRFRLFQWRKEYMIALCIKNN